jgi:tetratricopeptide (TPR) repeat protein
MKATTTTLIATVAILVPSLAGCGLWKDRTEPATQLGSLPLGGNTASNDPRPDPRGAKSDLLLAMARNEEQQGHYLAAAKKYRELLAEEWHPVAARRLAINSIRLGEPAKADSLFAECLNADPTNADLLADAAYWKYLQGEFDASEELARRGLEQDPYLARLHNNLGLVLANRGDTEGSIKAFQSAGCSRQQATANLGHAMLSAGNRDQAKEYLSQASQGSSPDPKASRTIAKLAQRPEVVRTSGHSTK